MAREPSGFPPGFAPRRYQRRTPGQGQALGHWPEITPPTSAKPPIDVTHSQRAPFVSQSHHAEIPGNGACSEGSRWFTRPTFPLPVTPGWAGTLGLLPWASHLAVTRDARQGGDGPLDTGPDSHHLQSDPPLGAVTHLVRPHVAPRRPGPRWPAAPPARAASRGPAERARSGWRRQGPAGSARQARSWSASAPLESPRDRRPGRWASLATDPGLPGSGAGEWRPGAPVPRGSSSARAPVDPHGPPTAPPPRGSRSAHNRSSASRSCGMTWCGHAASLLGCGVAAGCWWGLVAVVGGDGGELAVVAGEGGGGGGGAVAGGQLHRGGALADGPLEGGGQVADALWRGGLEADRAAEGVDGLVEPVVGGALVEGRADGVVFEHAAAAELLAAVGHHLFAEGAVVGDGGVGVVDALGGAALA